MMVGVVMLGVVGSAVLGVVVMLGVVMGVVVGVRDEITEVAGSAVDEVAERTSDVTPWAADAARCSRDGAGDAGEAIVMVVTGGAWQSFECQVR